MRYNLNLFSFHFFFKSIIISKYFRYNYVLLKLNCVSKHRKVKCWWMCNWNVANFTKKFVTFIYNPWNVNTYVFCKLNATTHVLFLSWLILYNEWSSRSTNTDQRGSVRIAKDHLILLLQLSHRVKWH